MEEKSIRFYGIKTNNLKDLNISIPLNKITAITGISGGGKSSLAYETIYKKCRNEYSFISDGGFDSVSYNMDFCENIIPSIALKQKNSNVNPHSTIYSFISLSELIGFGGDFRLPSSLLKLNKPGNECPHCLGNRLKAALDIEKIVDANKDISENPFRCWSGVGKNKYSALLTKMCDSLNIASNTKFGDLKEDARQALLRGVSDTKYQVSYTVNGKRRSRSEIYIGPILELEGFLKSKKISEYSYAEKFCKLSECDFCNGSGLNKSKYESYMFRGVSFYDFLTLPIDRLIQIIDFDSDNEATVRLSASLKAVSSLGIGYLSLSRSIPSLSGGELQKLKFSKVVSSQISGVLFVIDEISAQVNYSDHNLILGFMREICSRGNTIILIEHSEFFIKEADVVLNIGPYAGASGGYLVEGLEFNKQALEVNDLSGCDYLRIEGLTKNNLKEVSVSLPINRVTGVYGVCGSGKSSFAKAISEKVEGTVYISQEVLKGNSRSTVATYLDLSDSVADMYSESTKSNRELFLAQSGKINVCPVCDGTALVDYVRGFEKTVKVECPECEGARFSNLADCMDLCGVNIKDFFNMAVLDVVRKDFAFLPRLKSKLILLISLGLGHLSLGRKISSLSGGEAKRLKIAKFLHAPKPGSILIVDEPGSGLDDKTALSVLSFIKSLSRKFKSIIIIEHKDFLLKSCDHCLCFGPGAGSIGGKIVHAGSYILIN